MSDLLKSTQVQDAKRIVIKIGSALLVDEAHGTVHRKWLDSLAADIAAVRARGQEVVIVTSGAIAVGRRHLDLPKTSLRLDEKQAAAACGNIRLAHAYQEVLGHHQITVAQILVTLEDSENRRRYINARNTIETLLKVGAVPLINENDSVATDEIRFGDNDRLAARVAAMISADTLVLFSDIDGLYTADPSKDENATFIPVVDSINADIEAMASGSASDVGSGGMTTKIAAAKIAINAGCRMVITKGEREHPLKALEDGAKCTWFLPAATPKKARKQWISGSLKPVGEVIVDGGAIKALKAGKSLLPIGVKEVKGDFMRGEAVTVKGPDGVEIGRGLIAYGSEDARKIVGVKSSEIKDKLGYIGRDEMIHRDHLVVEL
ncbi:gamma-glutamate kinase [Candidatus Terasakiella magnetica]|uniref:Glutamate 5-kinase n=1 Tax=Candidatus Terasakiella magnetica TaxID=1867952 RepID=A0A1C3REG2_9PROT|nr:glutamate 5-kinase [Candidatus Terasakiella magnetica]SCA55673.1 gamma-glutamate kinase [Candidatus Terasakiella magnetica]